MTDVAPFNVESIDPTKTYDVVLAKPIDVHGNLLLPRNDHWMVGAFLTQIVSEVGADAIYRATPRPK